MFVHERPVRFEDLDVAGVVFFPRYPALCHEAMEALFAGLDGGYPGLVVGRGLALSAVRLDVTYAAPLRYGDVARIEVGCARIGRSSADLVYGIRRASDGVTTTTVLHTVVCLAVEAFKSAPLPADVRAILEAHPAPEP